MRSSPSTRPPASVQRPTLSVSSAVLTFPEAVAGQSRFQVLTLAQQYADSPVTLTTDAPDYFQLACDARPAFAPSLTLTPPPEGTHIHVRYVATKPGQHMGQLLIQSPYDTQAITLHARNGGLASLIRPDRTAHVLAPVRSGGFLPKQWGVVTAFVLGGLALVGYANRCWLAPRFCDETTTVVTETAVPVVTPKTPSATPAVPATLTKAAKNKTRTGRRVSSRRTAETAEQVAIPEAPEVQTRLSGSENTGRDQAADRNPERRDGEFRSSRRSRRRPAPEAAPTEVSELEQELNRKPNN